MDQKNQDQYTSGIEGVLHWIHLPAANRHRQPCGSTHGPGARASPPRTRAAAPSTATAACGTARVPPRPKAHHSRWRLLAEKMAISHLLGNLKTKFCNFLLLLIKIMSHHQVSQMTPPHSYTQYTFISISPEEKLCVNIIFLSVMQQANS